jgi:hypothetical protein
MEENTLRNSDLLPYPLSKFNPLPRIICYDDFDRGTCGWVDLTPNLVASGFRPVRSSLDLMQWGPTMLSTATFPYVGTHGSMDGIYSLKLTTQPVANPYVEPPRPGSFGHAVKRLTMLRQGGQLQFEMYFTYKPEQDREGLGEQDVRAFGFLFDVQDDDYRYVPGVRYLNAVDGSLKQVWQYAHADDVTDADWEYGMGGAWHKRGIDPQWFGRRYPDGSTDGFKAFPNPHQQLCYNETGGKINWLYLRFLIDLGQREYVELQCCDRVFDLRGLKPTLVDPYKNIRSLMNMSLWVEADTDRRAFLFVDSVVISTT